MERVHRISNAPGLRAGAIARVVGAGVPLLRFLELPLVGLLVALALRLVPVLALPLRRPDVLVLFLALEGVQVVVDELGMALLGLSLFLLLAGLRAGSLHELRRRLARSRGPVAFLLVVVHKRSSSGP